MAQVQQETQQVDPVTQAFVVERQNFWLRFTGFTTYVAVALVVLLVLMWLFLV